MQRGGSLIGECSKKRKKKKKRKRIRYDLCAAFRRDATFSRAFSAQAIRLRGITRREHSEHA